MTLSGSERLVIICGLADGGEGFFDLKELKARVAGDCGGFGEIFGIDPGCIGVCGYLSFGVLATDVIGPSDRLKLSWLFGNRTVISGLAVNRP
jgi:phage shock protein PspC (stress-responsive transcriptional regulator)